MDDDQQFCLRWNNHQSTLISVFDTLLENQTLVDCTLAAEGKFLKAHKVVLSACSPYFATLLQEQYDKHPIFILKDVKFQELRAMMDYMYRGEVNISQDQLAALLKAAESLQIKGLSDNRSTGNINPAPKLDGAHQQHRNLNVGANVGIKIGGGYTLEQTKRTRLGPNALDVQEMSGSREGSSSPSRRRKKVRRRSIEASLADIQHDNSNSSLQQQSNVVISAPGISNVNPISAAASVLAAAQLPSGATPGTVVGTSQTVASSSSAAAAAAAANIAPGLVAAATQQMLTNVTKKTESVKGAASSEAMNTDELATGVSVDEQEQQQQTATKVDKHNHKYKATSGKDSTDIVEPKSEYDDDGNEGTVEDLTLDEEDMGIDDLDQNAGTSHVGEGSSQGYAPWQHERSQDDLLMTQQDAQQRDPQDLSRKENCAPLNQILQANPRISLIQHAQQHKRSQSVGADVDNKTTNTRKKLSMSEMSDMLLEFYKANVSQKLPKPDEADSNAIPILPTAKNSQSDEMMNDAASISANNNNSIFTKTNDKSKSSFHRQNNKLFARPNETAITIPSSLTMTAIPTSVVVPTHTAQVDVKPVINPATGLIVSNPINAAPISVIKPVLASALMEGNTGAAQLPATKLLENFLIRTQREHRLSDECDDTNSDANDGDDEDDSRYNGFEDIHLMEGNVTTKTNVSNLATVDYLSDESQKFMIAQAQAQALRQLEYTLGDYSASSSIRNMTTTNRNEGQNESANTDAVYECRHCGKKYRWKSTLRRHENVECGGKEPSHQCPYCAYKSKQRGNLGVHVRKHHSNLPQLVSKRRSKYSHKLENSDITCENTARGGFSSANVSDDSSNKMIIDFSK